jgi:hypothetical protein
MLLTTALLGFHASKIRHDEARVKDDLPGLLIPLSECAYWACVLDEQLRSPQYDQRRNADDAGRTLVGLRYARDLSTHQLPLVVERIEGARFPIMFPLVFFEITWQRAAELPTSTRDGPWKRLQRENYVNLLEGHPTRLTIHTVAEWFAREQNTAGSPLNLALE